VLTEVESAPSAIRVSFSGADAMLRYIVFGVGLWVALATSRSPAAAAEPDSPAEAGAAAADADADAAAAAREARLQAMRKIAERFTVQPADPAAKAAPLIETPLMRFNDPARDFHDATLWGWGEKGRPLCLLAVEQYGDNSWFECISLAERQADATFAMSADKLNWRPQASGVELKPFPDAAPPAAKAPRRLAQMKELLERLSVHEVGRTGSRYELRLMPKPLFRYDDADADVQDGAIFAFAYGTNPELLAILEARGKAAEMQWLIGFARCGTAEPHVVAGEREIFQLPYARQTKPADPYWNFSYRFAEPK
jgi:hypothetical protein